METENKHRGAGHRKRLRERFLSAGISGFQDYEVLELLLSLNTPRRDTKQAAKDLMAEFETLPRVMEASTEALCRIHGVPGFSAEEREIRNTLHELSQSLFLAFTGSFMPDCDFTFSVAETVSGKFVQRYFHYVAAMERGAACGEGNERQRNCGDRKAGGDG